MTGRLTCTACEAPQKCPRCNRPLKQGFAQYMLALSDVLAEKQQLQQQLSEMAERLSKAEARAQLAEKKLSLVSAPMPSTNVRVHRIEAMASALLVTGDVLKAAERVGLGKTTLYRNLAKHECLRAALERGRAGAA